MINLSSEQSTVLMLLRQAIQAESSRLPDEINWEVVNTIAAEQGVSSLVYAGAMNCNADIPVELVPKWQDRMFRCAVKNELLMYAQSQLIIWLNQAEIPAVILKGSSVARYYPQPEYRVLGDIDILVSEENLKKAQTVLEQHGYQVHESDHEFHVGLSRGGNYVELHYHVTGFPDSQGGRKVQRYASDFLDDIRQGAMANYVFPVLSEENQALSLLLHMIRHMFTTGIGLRQVCDWAMYVVSVEEDRFTKNVIPLLANCGLLRYAKVVTKACICYLGVPNEGLCWCMDVTEEDCQTFIDEVFRLGNMGKANHEGMGSVFTNEKSMGKHENAVIDMLSGLTELSYKRFPLTRKLKILLPVFWIYLPLRYWVRSKMGLRSEKSIAKVISSAKKQRIIYEVLRPFEIEE